MAGVAAMRASGGGGNLLNPSSADALAGYLLFCQSSAMPAREIKPKPITPPTAYSDQLATVADRSEAESLTTTPFIFSRIVLAVPTFYIVFKIFESSLQLAGITKLNGGEGGLIILVWLFISILIIWFFPKAIRDSIFSTNLKKIVENRLRNEHSSEQRKEDETVLAAVAKAETIYCAQKSNLKTLAQLVEQAEDSLNQALQLFKERAYTPFWDSIENAVESLRQFDKRVNYINQSANEYYASLEGREHTYPAFPLRSEDLPNPNALIKRLAERIAEAQRDFQFASIFEQRRTTSAIVAGFRNTQEAINSLRNDIVSSLSDLQNSLESGLENISSNIREGFDDLAESHEHSAAELRETLDGYAEEASKRNTKHQKFTEDALDNIQNRRKPRISETKEPFRPSED